MLLITGASGQLGLQFRELLTPAQALFLSSAELDITDPIAVGKLSERTDLSGIINCGAYTAVDLAETERDRAEAVNVTALHHLGGLAQTHQIPIVHVSTDYVFNGENYRPYREIDLTDPINFYGETKLRGEAALLARTDYGAVVRTSWVYGKQGKNFVSTIIRAAESRPELRVIFDQIGTPTYAADLATALLKIVRNLKPDLPKIYHFSNEGVASWYDFAKAIIEIRGLSNSVIPILTEEYPTRAKRPHYSVLDKALIKKTFDLKIPHWREGLKKCLTST